MGISGLLPFLKKSSVNTHVRQFKGKTVAIDAYCWLHKGAFSCADKLVKGEKTEAYVTYCMKFINMLLSNEIKPILVFDGQPLPSKLGTEVKRRENRERNKIMAREYLRQGNNSKARECFQKCVDVTSAMALELIKVCRARNIDCIVAPYEADAQLAYLAIEGIAHFIITEDSDLLAFGCPRVLFKMDQSGNGVLIEKDNLYLSLGGRADFFNDEKFRRMCILSGCDYLPSLPGIGLGKAFKFFSRTTNGDINSTLCQIPGCLNMPSLEITSEYRTAFIKAEQTFLYQLVYDPNKRTLRPLKSYPSNLDPDTLHFAGKYMDDKIAFELAIGNLDAETLERLDTYNPDTVVVKKSATFQTKHVSIWSKNFVVKQDNLSSGKPESVKAVAAVSKQTTATVIFSLPKTADEARVISDSELINQCTMKESPSSPVLTVRKRKRTDENCSPLQNQYRWSAESVLRSEIISVDDIEKSSTSLPSVLDPFAEPLSIPTSLSTGADCVTPLRKSNPFVKLKTPSNDTTSSKTSPATSRFSAIQTFSQLKKKDANGQEVVTSAYFQSEKVYNTDQLKMSVLSSDNQVAISMSNSPKSSTSPTLLTSSETSQAIPAATRTPLSGCRVAGLSRRNGKLSAKPPVANGMRQLDLRSMFSAKP